MEEINIINIQDIEQALNITDADLVIIGQGEDSILTTTVEKLKNHILSPQIRSDITDTIVQVTGLFGNNLILYQDIDVSSISTVDPKGALTTVLDPKLTEATLTVQNHNLNGARLILLSTMGESGAVIYEGDFYFEGENIPSVLVEGGLKYEFIWNTSMNKWREIL